MSDVVKFSEHRCERCKDTGVITAGVVVLGGFFQALGVFCPCRSENMTHSERVLAEEEQRSWISSFRALHEDFKRSHA